MERELQNIFQHILNDTFRAPFANVFPPGNRVPSQVPTPTQAQVPAPAPAQAQAQAQEQGQVPAQSQSSGSRPNISNNQHILDTMDELIYSYNQVMRGYNDNIYTMANILRDCVEAPLEQNRMRNRSRNAPLPRRLRTPPSAPIYTNTTTNALPNQPNFTNIPFFTYLFYPDRMPPFSDVVVRPTEEEINNATEIVTYSSNDNHVNTSCPITLDEFQEGDVLCKIKNCSHLFRETSIHDWFQTNVRCPVCRYDIRTGQTDMSNNNITLPVTDASTNNVNTLDQSIDLLLDGFSGNLSSVLENMLAYPTPFGSGSIHMDTSGLSLRDYNVSIDLSGNETGDVDEISPVD